jgi:serine/threonine protein kinase
LALERDGVRVDLERRPTELLRLMLLHAGEVVTKDEMLDALWPDRVVTENSLTKCVARLRQALGDDDQSVIRTVHGYGYQFAAELRIEARPTQAAPVGQGIGGLQPGDAVPHRRNWRLIERLGVGGSADAWLGEHAKTHERRVFKFAHDGTQLSALKREITLSRLLADRLGARDDIARVLDWNLEAAPFFLEREWSPDGALSDWAEASGGIAAIPLAGRLDIAARIGDALAAAHSVGVLHKDIKPANILIHQDEVGQLRIRLADFGSGGAFDTAQLDRFGITPLGFTTTVALGESGHGTLLYLAPEMLRGGTASVQADIYALGVVLFQLVIGDFTRPFAPGWEAGVPDELLREDIALAASGDPASRIGDAASLAQRLRTLDQRRAQHEAEMLERAANDAAKRTLEQARARRGPLLVLFATLLIALSLTSWFFLRAEQANRRSQQLAATSDAVTAFLTQDLLSSANPYLSADPNIGVKELLSSATANLDRRFKPGSVERAAIEEALGHAYSGLGDAQAARPLLDSALASRKRLYGDADPATQRVRLDLLELDKAVLDNADARTIGQEILAQAPKDAETELRARDAIAVAECNEQGSSQLCIEPLKRLMQEARDRLGPHSEFFLQSESTLAKVISLNQRFDEAIPMAREALALTTDIDGPHHPLVADRKFRLAQVLIEAKQYDEGIRLCSEARADLLAVSGKETEESVTIANDLGIVYYQQKRYAEAAPLFQLALDYNVKAFGEAFSGSREDMNDLAFVYAGLGRFDEAIETQARAVALDARTIGPDHPEALWREKSLGGFYERSGDLNKAEAIYRSVLTRARGRFVNGEWDLGQMEFALGALLAKQGKTDEARNVLTESAALLDKSLGAADPHTKAAQAALAALVAPGK